MSDVRTALLDGSREPGPLSKSALPVRPGDLFAPESALPTPLLTIDLDAVIGNIAAMADWCRGQHVELAPHGKTSMAPQLWRAQLAAGAVGITVATPAQARVAAQAGVGFVILANEAVDPVALGVLAGILDTSDARLVCWVDSVETVGRMEDALAALAPRRPLEVCIELGALGARTGLRDDAGLDALVDRIVGSPHLSLAGIAGYEGSVPAGDGTAEDAVTAFLDRLGAALRHIAGRVENAAPLLTAGGSVWFDLVVARLRPVAEAVPGARLVLRSGAYVLHDHLHYAHETPAATRSGPPFTPAATLWARVVSTPEPGLALLDAGKRDLAYDIHLPVPVAGRRADGTAVDVSAARVFGSNDQHAYVRTGDADLRVGDLIELGQAHPCTIADKWRDIPVVSRAGDGALRLDGFVSTYF